LLGTNPSRKPLRYRVVLSLGSNLHFWVVNRFKLLPSSLFFQLSTKVLGQGKFGKVTFGEWWGTSVALKTLENFDLEENHELFQKGIDQNQLLFPRASLLLVASRSRN